MTIKLGATRWLIHRERAGLAAQGSRPTPSSPLICLAWACLLVIACLVLPFPLACSLPKRARCITCGTPGAALRGRYVGLCCAGAPTCCSARVTRLPCAGVQVQTPQPQMPTSGEPSFRMRPA